jgi:hypothetical protein
MVQCVEGGFPRDPEFTGPSILIQGHSPQLDHLSMSFTSQTHTILNLQWPRYGSGNT